MISVSSPSPPLGSPWISQITSLVQIWESGVCDVLGAPHLTVHDELDLSLPTGGEEALAEIKNIMQTCVDLAIPLIADLTVASSWGK